MRRPALCLLACQAVPARAHVAGGPGSAAWSEWRPEVWIVAAILLTLGAYLLGLVRLWRASGVGRGIGVVPAVCFLAGVLALVAALASPLERLAGVLLTAHMIQHVILIAVAPPLLVIGRPDVAYPWATPRATRRGLARQPAARGLGRLLHPLLRPIPAALLHGAALWIWHAPPLFQAALADPLLHDLEHASFFLTALAFWYATLVAVRSPGMILAAMVGIVLTLILCGLMGALITLSRSVLYPAYVGATTAFGLTPLEDQQLAGLVMWVPAGALYLAAGIYLAARLLHVTERRAQRAPAWQTEREKPRLAEAVRGQSDRVRTRTNR